MSATAISREPAARSRGGARPSSSAGSRALQAGAWLCVGAGGAAASDLRPPFIPHALPPCASEAGEGGAVKRGAMCEARRLEGGHRCSCRGSRTDSTAQRGSGEAGVGGGGGMAVWGGAYDERWVTGMRGDKSISSYMGCRNKGQRPKGGSGPPAAVGGAREPPEPPLQPGLRDRRHHLRGLHPGPPGPRRPPQPALPRRRHPRPSLIAGRQPTPGPGSLAGPSPFRSDDGSDGPACSSPPPPNPPPPQPLPSSLAIPCPAPRGSRRARAAGRVLVRPGARRRRRPPPLDPAASGGARVGRGARGRRAAPPCAP